MIPGRPRRGRPERLLEIYRRRIARCRTPNQINRVHIGLTDYLTPAEFRALAAAMANEPAASPGRYWADSLTAMLPSKKQWPSEFERVGLANGCSLYTSGLASREQKTLIIGFAGNSKRLMVPPALLLDCLDPAAYDLIILRDYAKAFYLSGIPGLGSDFFELVSAIGSRFGARSYRSALALGTSGGGIPALLAAIALGLDRGVAIGAAAYEEFDEWRAARGVPEEPFRALLASRPAPYPDLTLVFGAEHAADRDRAVALGKLVPSRLRGVRDCDRHGILGWALERGMLPAIVSAVLA